MSTHSHQECLAARAGNLRRYGLNASDRPRAVSLVTLLVPSRASSLRAGTAEIRMPSTASHCTGMQVDAPDDIVLIWR
jgi:hypothetical protein